MSNVLSDLFFPQSADQVGTQRVEAINNVPWDQQIRNVGSSVIDAMLGAAQDQLVAAAAGTQVGQNVINTYKQQQMQQWAPFVIFGGLILIVFLLLGRKG
jgi:hypothetical protein